MIPSRKSPYCFNTWTRHVLWFKNNIMDIFRLISSQETRKWKRTNEEAPKSRKHRNMLWKHVTYSDYWMRVRILKSSPGPRFHSDNAATVFRAHNAGRIWKSETLTGHFGFFFFGNLVQVNGVCMIDRDAIVFVKLRFQNVVPPHENAKPASSSPSYLKSVFEGPVFVTD